MFFVSYVRRSVEILILNKQLITKKFPMSAIHMSR